MEVRYLVEKWNIYDAHIFTRSLVQTCSFESSSLFLHSRLRVNKKFPNSHYFFETNINPWLLGAHLLKTSIILHSRRSVNKKNVMHLGYMFHLIFFFRILWSWKARLSHRSISHNEVRTKEVQVLGCRKSCKGTK